MTLDPTATPPAEWYSKGTHHVPQEGSRAVALQSMAVTQDARVPRRIQHILSDADTTSSVMPVPILNDTLRLHGVTDEPVE